MTQETQAPVEAQEIVLELADIANATKIMKAAIERGVFQAEEMSGVSGVFDKFNAFILATDERIAEANAKAEADVGSTGDQEADAE